MRQTLFYIPRELLGLPVFGFGLLLAIWVFGGLGMMAWLLWRGRGSDARALLPIFFLVAALIVWLLPAICQSQGVPVRGFGAMNVVGFAAGTALAAWRARRVGLHPDLILSLAFWALVPGILGARLFYVIEYWPTVFWPVFQEKGFGAFLGALVNVTQGGLVVYGSFLGALPGLWGFARQYRLPWLAICDLIAPSLMLGLALGRVGCLMNGCCYGGPCALPWAVTFPPDSPVHFHQVAHGQTFLDGLKIAADPQGRPAVQAVEPGSQPQQLGLRPGQLVVRINGLQMPTLDDAAAALLAADKITVETAEDPYVAQWPLDLSAPGEPPRQLGQQIADVRQGRVFIHGLRMAGSAQGQPIIEEVQSDSPARRHGLKPGQRITRIDGREIKTAEEAAWALVNADRIAVDTAEGRKPSTWRLQAPAPGSAAVLPVHPTQIYGAINAALLCLLLLAYDPLRRRDGELFALMLTLYPITRFLLEIIRVDESSVFHTGLSISQNVSLLVLLVAAGLWFYVLRRPPGRALPILRSSSPADS